MNLKFPFSINKKYCITVALGLILISPVNSQTKSHNKKMEIKLYSSAFKEGEFIPEKFSCEGSNISPQLHWSNYPQNTKSFAVIVEDPDAPGGDFVHWIIYNIPGNLSELHEDVTPSRNIPDEVMLGTNGFGKISYGGPCPPPGKPHRYFFRIYALDTILHHLETGATRQQLISNMSGHIIAEGRLMGKYQRKN
jgi:Raf kinase inhibitor-like YbhB/YbcL family protein